MKQYRCNNCDHQWESQDVPFECPKCHSASIVEVGGKPSFADTIKKYWWIIACAVAAALLVILIMPKNATRVKVNADTEIGRMVIKIKGKHASEYLVMLKQNDNIDKQAYSKDGNPVIFNDLRGDYVLELMYTGQGEAPKVRKYQKEYSFNMAATEEAIVNDDIDTDLTISSTPRPEIVKLEPTPKRIAEGETYTVTIKLSPYGCSEAESEFSMDGENWQDKPSFSNLTSGDYKFYARNKKMPDLMSNAEVFLQEAHSKECLSVEKANALLPSIAKSDDKAIDTFYKYVSRNTEVKGVEEIRSAYGLIVAIREDEQVNYIITSIDCSNGKVNSITIKNK